MLYLNAKQGETVSVQYWDTGDSDVNVVWINTRIAKLVEDLEKSGAKSKISKITIEFPVAFEFSEIDQRVEFGP